MQGPIERTEPDIKKLREELARLRLKLENSSDRDIRSVLQMRIDQIVADLKAAPTEEAVPDLAAPEASSESAIPEEVVVETTPMTPEQLREGDRLISQARVEKMRGNSAKANELLQSAAAVAPGSPVVMEALGDSYMERRQVKAAIQAYKTAFKLAPKNVAVEEKLATAALQLASIGSIEEQLRAGESSSPFLTSQDIVARKPYAVLLSAIFPGSGHLALGQTVSGLVIMSLWILCGIWLLVMRTDVEKLVKMTRMAGVHPNMTVLIPLGMMALLYMGSLGAMKSTGAVSSRDRNVARPKPPVDLPFD